ncbi:MAG: DUF192 domain-containing protein [Sedimenticola sp.]|nr:DUF192 domain-containing protein [Sedimenticola sp.]
MRWHRVNSERKRGVSGMNRNRFANNRIETAGAAWRRLLLLSLVALSLWGCQGARLALIQVGDAQAIVLLAESEEQRQRGLMHRRWLGQDEGLLMIFPGPQEVSLWMLNTRIPLDVGFFDQRGVLTAVLQMEPDGGRTLHHSPPATRYALEMNRGWFQRHRLQPGVRLRLDDLRQASVDIPTRVQR